NDSGLADGDAAQNRAAGADRSPAFYDGPYDLPVSLGLQRTAVACSAGIPIINKGHVVADKDIILNLNPLTDEGVARHFNVGAELCILLDLDKGADLAVIADR